MSAAHAGSSFFAPDLNLKMRTLPSFTVKKTEDEPQSLVYTAT